MEDYFTSFHKAKAINKIYKLTQKKIGVKQFFFNYEKDVIKTRNIFAHVKEVEIDGKKVLVSTSTGGEENFNEDRCIEIRKDLIKYREILEDIKNQIGA